MTRSVSLAFAVATLSWATCAQAAEVTGTWLTNTADAHIRMSRCGPGVCGTIVWLKDPKDGNGRPLTDAKNPDPAKRSHPLLGTMIAIDFRPARDNPEQFVGRFYNADDGKTYRGTIVARGPDQLAVTGCLLIFCQTQTWTRVKR
jgi:uncharacterized protein (DUF2147 family)